MAIRVYSSDLYVELAIKYRAGAYPRNPALARVRRYLAMLRRVRQSLPRRRLHKKLPFDDAQCDYALRSREH